MWIYKMHEKFFFFTLTVLSVGLVIVIPVVLLLQVV